MSYREGGIVKQTETKRNSLYQTIFCTLTHFNVVFRSEPFV
jgi:hypothetical protein